MKGVKLLQIDYTKRMRRKVLALIVALVLLGLSGGLLISSRHRPATTSTSPTTTARPFDHIVIILEENKPANQIVDNADAPYLNHLITTYAYARNYHAITNPSLPNYIALTSGTTAGIHTDCSPSMAYCQAKVASLADRLEQAGHSWKAYVESMPAPCATANSGDYAVRHNPFVYFPQIRNDEARCRSHDVPFSALTKDLQGNTLPDFAFITPNLCSDMHDCPIKTGDDWLAREVPKILRSDAFTKQRSLLVVTWDEGNARDNHVPTIFIGPAARRGYTSPIAYTHYSLLHTIEDAWHLPTLTGNDTRAPLMTDMLE